MKFEGKSNSEDNNFNIDEIGVSIFAAIFVDKHVIIYVPNILKEITMK